MLKGLNAKKCENGSKVMEYEEHSVRSKKDWSTQLSRKVRDIIKMIIMFRSDYSRTWQNYISLVHDGRIKGRSVQVSSLTLRMMIKNV